MYHTKLNKQGDLYSIHVQCIHDQYRPFSVSNNVFTCLNFLDSAIEEGEPPVTRGFSE